MKKSNLCMHGNKESLNCVLSCERTYCTTARAKQPTEPRLAQPLGRETALVTVLAAVTLGTVAESRRREPSAME